MNDQRPAGSGSPERIPRSSVARWRAAFAAGVVIVAGLSVLGLYSRRSGAPQASPPQGSGMTPVAELPPASPLEADHLVHEFGEVPIAGGILEASFTITNPGERPENIVSVYTSCMCTTAVLHFPDGATEGPFGMPGHELPLTLSRELGSGEALTMVVRFDPAAHGPDATGPVEREVALHTADGGTLLLSLTASVIAE